MGLRARITLAFTLGSLLLAVGFSTSTWAFTRQSQLNLRETSALQRLYSNAGSVRNLLLSGGSVDLRAFLSSLPTPANPIVLQEVEGESLRTSASLRAAFEDLPPALRDAVSEGDAALMRYRIADEPVLAVGVPLPAVDAQYYEIVSLAELERSLDLLAAYLAGAAAVTILAGATLGWWASRRTLLPLADVGAAAQAIARGQLDTRLEAANDPDLEILVESFNEMVRALQQRIERDARFASDVSHELRSPLMTLAASIEVLQTRRDEMPERSRAALDLLVDDVSRFQQLVADLLEISRFDSGAAHLSLEPVLLADFVQRATRAASEVSVPLIADPGTEDLVVTIDKRRMAQVLANLLDNARKYAGGATAIHLSQVGENVEIAVEDEGPGIEEADREKIFDRFSRGSGAGARSADSGTGLGLALVSEHVRLHGGSVRVEDLPGGAGGARFVISLPSPVEESEVAP